MKFCYLDESGMGEEPFATMAGVIVDAARMGVTKADWVDFVSQLSNRVGKQIQELHANDFFQGNGMWKSMPGQERKEFINSVLGWVQDRKHELVFSAVDKSLFKKEFSKEKFGTELKNYWQLMAVHIALCLQKNFQRHEKNKGNFLLIFDKAKSSDEFAGFLLSMPEWTDTFYKRGKKQPKLDQLVDVPHFVDSKHVGLVQLADLITLIVRKYIELKSGRAPAYTGEMEDMERWMSVVDSMSVQRHLSRGRCPAGEFFYKYYPACLK